MAVHVDEQYPAVGMLSRLTQCLVSKQVGKTYSIIADSTTQRHVGRQIHTTTTSQTTRADKSLKNFLLNAKNVDKILKSLETW